ncbi:MAG: hypothetical protein FWC96_03190 [Oscillospiraceae bacterium]|nr:hypothetical protein [Oscillospiraceae bacterium]
MKKILATILTIALLISAVAVTAFAAPQHEDLAVELNQLGLFQGTGEGFALENAPTRAQALVMLLRLLGLEDAALESDYEHPFTDVPDWVAPYVAYAFNNDLTTGTTATTFSPDATASAQMYLTFVLRALGFTDEDAGEDFTLFQVAVELGTEIGVFTASLEGPFLRDQMVAISYLALGAQPADGEFNTLLDSLVASGAVDADAAAPLMQRFELLHEFAAFDDELEILNYTVEATVGEGQEARIEDETIYVYVDGEEEALVSFTYNASAIIDGAAATLGNFANLALMTRDISRTEAINGRHIIVYIITVADGTVVRVYIEAGEPTMAAFVLTELVEGVTVTITITVEFAAFEEAVTLPADVNGEEEYDEEYENGEEEEIVAQG